jgi:hypothetical protein
MDDLRGRRVIPRNQADRARIRLQVDIAVGRIGDRFVFLVGVLAGDGLDEDAFREPQPILPDAFQIFLGRQDLAARNSCHVRDEAFHLIDGPAAEPLLDVLHDTLLFSPPPPGRPDPIRYPIGPFDPSSRRISKD